MSRTVSVFAVILITLILFIQSIVLKSLYVIPDVSFILIIYFSLKLGAYRALGVGFFSGFIEDILSISPLGFNAFIKTIISFLWGNFKGKMFIDSFLVPIIIIIISTVMKAVLSLLLLKVFSDSFVISQVFNIKYVYELILNIVFCPIIFALMNLIPYLKNIRNDEF